MLIRPPLAQFPQLEKLEDEHISIIKERADMIAQRRKAEAEDDLALFLGTTAQPQTSPNEIDDLGRAVPSPAAARAGCAGGEQSQGRGGAEQGQAEFHDASPRCARTGGTATGGGHRRQAIA